MNLWHIRQTQTGWLAYNGRGTILPFNSERAAWQFANKQNKILLK